MNENIDLTKILAGCEGMKIYCLLTGEYVTLERTDSTISCNNPIKIRDKKGIVWYYPKEGYKYDDYPNGECMLVPSKENWDWSKFKKPIPVDTPMMCSDTGGYFWELCYYSMFYNGKHRCFYRGCKSKNADPNNRTGGEWSYMIPYDKFDPNNIVESLKYNIQK